MVTWLRPVGLALFLMVTFAGIDSSLAAERLALVISNQAYHPDVGRLSRTHEDGRLVAAALRQVGFDVAIVRDADKSTMRRAVADYIARLSRAGPSS